jgi:endonuclease YncB( thermonuclease family)
MPVERAQSIAPAANGGRYGLCANGVSANCVVDGGTFLQDGVKIRLADIEAPDPRAAHCADEERKATAATLRLQTLLNAGTFAVSASGRDQDESGRKLRIVMRAGRSVGDQLVAEGLAHRWNGRPQAWCGS